MPHGFFFCHNVKTLLWQQPKDGNVLKICCILSLNKQEKEGVEKKEKDYRSFTTKCKTIEHLKVKERGKKYARAQINFPDANISV